MVWARFVVQKSEEGAEIGSAQTPPPRSGVRGFRGKLSV